MIEAWVILIMFWGLPLLGLLGSIYLIYFMFKIIKEKKKLK